MEQIVALAKEDGRTGLKFRLSVTGGRCGGFQCGMSFEDGMEEDDCMLEFGALAMIIDPLSYQYLNGVRIDFVEDISGVPFVVDNPNATSTCSYGSSIDGRAARMPTYAGRD